MFWQLFWNGLFLCESAAFLICVKELQDREPFGNTDLEALKTLRKAFDFYLLLCWNHSWIFPLQLQYTLLVSIILENVIFGTAYVKITYLLQKLPLHSVQFIRPPLPSSLLISLYSGKNVCKSSLVPVKLKSCFLFLLHECFYSWRYPWLRTWTPHVCHSDFCLIARFIHGCSTAACLISQIFFSWLLPKHLADARFAIFSSYSQKIAASPLHTHTHLHIRLRERGERLHDFPFCSPFSCFCLGAQGSFTFSSAILSLVHLGKKLTVTCTSPGQGVLPHAAVLLQQCCCVCIPKGQWQNCTPPSWLLSLQGFHSCCAAHWGFQPAHSQVARYSWCEK